MITNILIEHPWLSPTALALLAVVGPPAGAWLTTRPAATRILLVLSLAPIAVLTLVPVDRELFARCEVAWALPTVGRVELAANVVLFVAPVLLLGVLLRRPLVALLGGTLLSVAVEAVQAAVPAIGRSCSTNDWLSNSIGAAIGALLALVALRIRFRRAVEVPAVSPGPPSRW